MSLQTIFSRSLFAFLMLTATLVSPQYAYSWGRFEGGHQPPPRNAVVVHEDYIHHGGHGCVGCGIGVAAVAGLATGVIIGSAMAPPPQTIVIGSQYAALPPGCQSMVVNGYNYFQCGPVWYQPFMGGNGMYYQVIPTP